ncbi:MAG: 5-methyltetrahydropteroyltriglutamate--homocysteine S-methyltransferase [Oscillospiraceae bacterium]
MKTSVSGFPRVGAHRELKFASERYFRGECIIDALAQTAAALRKSNWETLSAAGIDFIPTNDFSYYDGILDTIVLLGAQPARYKTLGLAPADEYFAMARGYQGKQGDVKALSMKKWFNTNYHYMVPELEDTTQLRLSGTKPFAEYSEAKALGFETVPTVTGAFTFIKLARTTGTKPAEAYVPALIDAYQDLLARFSALGTEWVAFDEQSLVMDLTDADKALFLTLYRGILAAKGSVNVLLRTSFGDVRDIYTDLTALDFDGIGLDFVEGTASLDLLKAHGFPAGKTLFAGVVNGKNIWKNRYAKTLSLLVELRAVAPDAVISTSCSLLHVPYTLDNEPKLGYDKKAHLAFAYEKLGELAALKTLAQSPDYTKEDLLTENEALFTGTREASDEAVRARVNVLTDADFVRTPAFGVRETLQKAAFRLPLLPTTTIGSFPQTAEVRANRAAFRKGIISRETYTAFNRARIADCVKLQEDIGLDVLVHGEFERNDMVEYFGENLNGFLFTEAAWVQSYGTRCVKPPVIWGDVSRSRPMTVDYAVFAQSLTKKPVKGMLTGPVTILNWSFPREDVSPETSAVQIALAIRDEVLDLEASGIRIIQVDEAALREKLPLRRSEWHSAYLDWAIPAFRLVHSGVKPETQIHTHMCYSEFADIIRDIDDMDADVITFEASRSDLTILDVLAESNFRTEVGPGVYDIHSPRIPTTDEITAALTKMLAKIPAEKLWVNPDCGLKTRGETETLPSLQNLVAAAEQLRASLTSTLLNHTKDDLI